MIISMTTAKMRQISRSAIPCFAVRGGSAAPEGSVPLTSLPNLLTLSRILAVPVVVATFYVAGDYARWFACALFTAAAVTDWLDGHMARRWAQQSETRPLSRPDRRQAAGCRDLVHADGVRAGCRPGALLPALVILCREILVSGLREYLAELRVGLPVSRLAKWKTAIQMTAIGFLIVGDAGPAFLPVEEIGEMLLWVAALLTLVTGYDYLRAGLAHMSQRQRPTPAPPHGKPQHWRSRKLARRAHVPDACAGCGALSETRARGQECGFSGSPGGAAAARRHC